MSLNSSLSGISFSGLGSNIDTDSIIKQLLQIDAIPIQTLQRNQADLNNQLTLMQQFSGAITAISSAAGNLSTASAFNPITSSVQDSTVATISATSSAAAGSYNLSITKLAQAHKLSSAAQSDPTSALSLSGTMIVNGKGVQIAASDSLSSIAQKVNGLGVGVTASVINGGQGSAYLTLTSSSTGAANKIQLGDLQGNVASTLGLVTGSDSIREAITGGATSYALSSQNTSLASVLNGNAVPQQTFSLNGVSVTFDPSTGTLQDLASAINTANTGATATVRTVANADGSNSYKLDIAGLSSSVDTTGFLKAIGVLQKGFGHEILTAQDAAFSLDGISLTSATNTVSTVIPGATIQLLKGTPQTPATTTITLGQDFAGIEKNVQGLVDAYNNMEDFVTSNSQLDAKTFQTGPLFGNSTVQAVQSQLSSALFNTVKGLPAPYNNLSAVGFSFSQDGKLQFDQSKLDLALKANPTAVSALFRATGSGSTSALSFISSTSKSIASGAGSYAVNITQIATQGSFSAQTAQTQPLASNELLTFNGAALGNSAYTVLLNAGATQNDIVNQINTDSRLKDVMTASVVAGKLTLTSKKYGSNGSFTLTSDTAASASSSGLQGGASVVGQDVAGTINGEAATGNGQYLVGNSGNKTTDGLQILYSGVTTGAIGNVSLIKGIGANLNDLLGSFTDTKSGLVSAVTTSLNTEISDIDNQVTDLKAQLSQTESDLRTKFSAMEQAISALKNQQAQLGSFTSTSAK
jgi:flagellar hook-associated protein 2